MKKKLFKKQDATSFILEQKFAPLQQLHTNLNATIASEFSRIRALSDIVARLP